ncbi:helix-turn-helix transcriptional regulator [Amaricoccus solimangrovi]|uniref:Transcriptional regulator n=1 Tax=Amaricoccus solimangrovi TaxID=2589815 RepID=A0A501X173_9RHOB|nr:transcriptional regulator [Amaricoccus solimangrovi]TPE53226.1 transcriptional regulator [Amaricoccus solimangrovi]
MTLVPEKSATHLLISATGTRQICGGISDMTLHRWLSDPALNFPRPVYIRKRRFWREAELLAWLEERAAASHEAA